jgi:Zinc finger, ZZ type
LLELEVKVNQDNLLKLHTDVCQFLKPRAIEMYCGNSGTSSLPEDWEKYTVEFKCFDSDGDLIFVRSNEDFRILFSQHSEGHRMKVLASVTPPAPTTEPGTDASASKSTQTQEKNETKTETDVDESQEKKAAVADEKDDKIVSAIAELFTIAALSMKAGVTAASHQENLEASKNASKQQIKNVKKASEDSIKAARKVTKESLKMAKKISKESFKQVCQALKTGVDVASNPTPESPSPPADGTWNVSEPTKESPTNVGAEEAPLETESPTAPELPFIHGRHTCDQCLTTPVIGKRFHALNKPDYDLCEACFGNYKGTDIVFEEMKLGEYISLSECSVSSIHSKPMTPQHFCLVERDIAFQERWNRRRLIHEASMKRRACLNGRRSCQRHKNRDAGRGATEHCEVNTQDVLVDIFVSESSMESADVSNDPALEEAIRRSLDDIALTENAAEKESISEENSDKVGVDIFTSSAPFEAENDDSLPAASIEDVVVEEDIVVDGFVENEPTEKVAKEMSFASEAIGSGDVAAFVGETLDRLSEAIENLSSEMEDYANGSKIVDGDEDAASTGSWSVVAEKEHAVSVVDEGLGRAAEAIGSALFQSDMMRSTEDATLSTMTNMSVASVPTFVPSIAPSEHDIPQAQLDRWAAQLKQLRELGFSDDAVCVDALEALAAANIGVDSDEEVSVQQVIEKLMSD